MPESKQKKPKVGKPPEQRCLFVAWHCLWCGKTNKSYTEHAPPPLHGGCSALPGMHWEKLFRPVLD